MKMPDWIHRLIWPPLPDTPEDLVRFEAAKNRVIEQCGRIAAESQQVMESTDTLIWMVREMADIDPVAKRWDPR